MQHQIPGQAKAADREHAWQALYALHSLYEVHMTSLHDHVVLPTWLPYERTWCHPVREKNNHKSSVPRMVSHRKLLLGNITSQSF